MGNHLVVYVHEAFEYLIHDILGFGFTQTIVRFGVTSDVCEEVASGAQLEEDMS